MSREAKPYWKKQQQRWVCTINGKRITLGADKKAAFAKFRTLMQQPDSVGDHVATIYALSQVYLDWCLKHRAIGTYNKCQFRSESDAEFRAQLSGPGIW